MTPCVTAAWPACHILQLRRRPGALAAGVKRAGLLIALIAAPLQVPALVFAAGAGRAALEGTGVAGANLMLTAAFSLAALALAPAGIAAALKARLE